MKRCSLHYRKSARLIFAIILPCKHKQVDLSCLETSFTFKITLKKLKINVKLYQKMGWCQMKAYFNCLKTCCCLTETRDLYAIASINQTQWPRSYLNSIKTIQRKILVNRTQFRRYFSKDVHRVLELNWGRSLSDV